MLPTTTNKVRSFWQRPEGVTGKITLGLITGAVVYGVYTVLPWIITLTTNLITASFLVAGLVLTLAILTSPQVHALLWGVFQITMRAITGMVIPIDPIAIIKGYIREMRKSLESMGVQIQNLRSQMSQLKGTIDTNAQEMTSNIKLAEQAQKKGNDGVKMVSANQAARLRDSNMRLQQLYTKMELMYRTLTKTYETVGLLIQDKENDVKMREIEWKSVKAAHSALSSAMRMFSGKSDQRLLFEQSMQYIADDMQGKVGEMQYMMEQSATVLESIDLQNGVYDEEGLKMLQDWSTKTTLLLGDARPVALKNSSDLAFNSEEEQQPVLVGAALPKRENKNELYKDLFN